MMITKIRTTHKSYCVKCQFVIRKGELANKDQDGVRHINCAAAIQDGSGRYINPAFRHLLDHMDPEAVSRILSKKKK